MPAGGELRAMGRDAGRVTGTDLRDHLHIMTPPPYIRVGSRVRACETTPIS